MRGQRWLQRRRDNTRDKEPLQRPATASGAPESGRLPATDGARHRTEEGNPSFGETLSEAVADGSAGQPLDAAVRQRLEPVLGHSFADVRVHADGEADHLARAVDSVAFTTGSDIFFRAGAYDPQTVDGLHLLAHEAAHAAQQASGPVDGTLGPQGAMVSAPSDAYERAADRAADGVVAAATTAPSVHEAAPSAGSRQPDGRLSSDVGGATSGSPAGDGAVPVVQRRLVKLDAPWWGSAPSGMSQSNLWLNPHAELYVGGALVADNWFPGGDTAGFTAAPGTTGGSIRLIVDVGWFQDNALFNYAGSGQAVVNVPFTVTPEGTLQWQGAMQSVASGGDGAHLVQPVAISTGTTATGGYVTVTPVLDGMGTVTSGVSTGGTVNVAPGGIGGTTNVNVSAQEASPRGARLTNTFTVNVDIPRPEVRPPAAEVLETSIGFQVASPVPEDEGRIVSWYMGLPDPVKRVVAAGGAPIVLTGHASTTGGGPANRELSRNRALRVQQILQDIAGSNARFTIQSLGEYTAGTGDNTEDANERRVDISITVSQDQLATAPRPSGP